VVAVALEGIWLLGHAPLVDDCTGVFESIELEQAIGGREEFCRSELLFHGLVGGVGARARAEIEHTPAAELGRHDDAAAVIFGSTSG
jgi:hypothetical protein